MSVPESFPLQVYWARSDPDSSPQSDCRRFRRRPLAKFAFCGTWNQDSTTGILRVRTLKLPTPVAGVPELRDVCLTLHACWTVGKEEDASELWGCQWQDRKNALLQEHIRHCEGTNGLLHPRHSSHPHPSSGQLMQCHSKNLGDQVLHYFLGPSIHVWYLFSTMPP